jgi:hypothetical protein
MIRQICLSCYKMTELTDDTAGKQVVCPNCQKPMDVPQKYSPQVASGGGIPTVPTAKPSTGVPPMPSDATILPPGVNVPATPQLPPVVQAPPPGTVTPSQNPPPVPSEYTGGIGFGLNPVWFAWVPLGCLGLAFILSFFPWTKLAPGGYTVLFQNGWDALAGGMSDTVPELPDWKELEKGLSGKLRADIFILPYLLLLIPTVALAVIERVVNPVTTKLPGPLLWIPRVWPYLLLLIGGLSVVLLLLLFFGSLRGFSLERSVNEIATAKFEEQIAKNPAGTELRKINIQIGQEAARYAPRQTTWLSILLLLHLLALLAILVRLWMNTRVNKNHPRISLQW